SDWITLTSAGKDYEDLLGIADWDGNPNNAWTTNVNVTVDAAGKIAFNGFYGDYNVGGQNTFANLLLSKGTTDYALMLTAPLTWSFWNASNSGTWGVAGNWTSGGVANSVGQTAYFGPAATGRSVTVESPKTVGMIALDSANPDTISGGTITLDGLAGQAAIYVASGSHQIDAPLALIDDTSVTVPPAGSTLTLTQLQPTSHAITKTGAGTLIANNIHASDST